MNRKSPRRSRAFGRGTRPLDGGDHRPQPGDAERGRTAAAATRSHGWARRRASKSAGKGHRRAPEPGPGGGPRLRQPVGGHRRPTRPALPPTSWTEAKISAGRPARAEAAGEERGNPEREAIADERAGAGGKAINQKPGLRASIGNTRRPAPLATRAMVRIADAQLAEGARTPGRPPPAPRTRRASRPRAI